MLMGVQQVSMTAGRTVFAVIFMPKITVVCLLHVVLSFFAMKLSMDRRLNATV
jgi:hypothetical protein